MPDALLEWDSDKMEFNNKPEANQFLRRTYRKGWSVVPKGNDRLWGTIDAVIAE